MRPIDADALVSQLRDKADELITLEEGSRGNTSIFYTGVKVGLQNAAIVADDFPTIDAVPVVRCKDCRWKEQEQIGMVYCPATVGGWVDEKWFCKGGERSEK